MPGKGNRFSCKHGPENTFILNSPLGELELVCCPKGIHKLHLHKVYCDADFKPNNDDVEIKSQLYADNGYTYKSALDTVKWLNTYFWDLRDLPSAQPLIICHLLKWSPATTRTEALFTDRVWATLTRDVGVGSTVSYGRLAEMSGSTARASRAVGQAMRSNPVMIVVPCHRVILRSGDLGNYSRGTKNSVKAWLIDHERCG